MNQKNNYAEQIYWDKSYESLNLDFDTYEDPVTKLIKEIVFPHLTSGMSVFELGCYPGRYLRIFSQRGLTLNGIDLTPKVKDVLPEFLKDNGCAVGNFYCDDIEKIKISEKHSLVCSFGLIEHFSNWDEIILKHISLLKPGGILIITTPNFKGFIQYLLHRYLDNENLKRHNIRSMNVSKWIQALKKSNLDFDILFSGAFGFFDFWVDNQKRNYLQRKVLKKILKLTNKLRNKIKTNHNAYSPYLGLIIKLK